MLHLSSIAQFVDAQKGRTTKPHTQHCNTHYLVGSRQEVALFSSSPASDSPCGMTQLPRPTKALRVARRGFVAKN